MTHIKSPFTVLRLVFNLFKSERLEIFYPYIIVVFVNLLLLEILYFSPRFPLSVFFSPIISHIWGTAYLHYPANLLLLPKLFYYAQIVLFLFFSNMLIALTVDMVAGINNEQAINFKTSFVKSMPQYVYIVLYSMLSLLLFWCFGKLYGHLLQRASQIHSTTGIYFWLKKAIFYTTPYVQFLYGIIITALLIYVPVLIILEKNKFFAALLGNFKLLFRSFPLTLQLVLLPMLFYLPLLLLRDNVGGLAQASFPEIQVWVTVLGVFIITAINIFTMASATTYYLYQKENT